MEKGSGGSDDRTPEMDRKICDLWFYFFRVMARKINHNELTAKHLLGQSRKGKTLFPCG
jgi:hypothetical protein